ncbi:MAG: DNA primase [Puniceicoccales bacterium]|jgi:DNA primase|nr:DNA primase [Puniceicoccales bacterium]
MEKQMLIKRECIEHIKAVADLYDIVSGYVQLKRSGASWKGLSPFTVEKTPSFFVHPEKKFFKCFSTGYAGDVFRFLEIKENFSFLEAVEWLAKRYGIAVDYERDPSPKNYSKNELFAIHEDAAAYFQKKFQEDAAIQRYWTKTRHFSLDTAQRYGIGWAPNFDQGLLALFRRKKYTPEALQRCGLLRGTECDPQRAQLRFTGRLMIPIYDVQDRIIAFSGRTIEGEGNLAKYINSPETPLFHKGSVLFGLNHARKFVSNHFILVEGPLDVFRCWENGLDEAVAPQGTGITEIQMNLLRRYVPKVLCLMDGDGAGQKCAQRAVELAFKTSMECQIATLDETDDPDSLLLREGKKGFEQLKKESMIPFLLRTLLSRGMEATAIEKEAFLKKIYEMIHGCDSEVTRRIYLDELTDHLHLDRRAILKDFHNFCGDIKFASSSLKVQNGNEKFSSKTEKLRTAEYDLLSLILRCQPLGLKIAETIDDCWIRDNKHGRLLLKVLGEVRKHMWEGPRSDSVAFIPEELNEFFSILALDGEVEDPIEMANACLRSICTAFAKDQLVEINQKELMRRKFAKDENSLDDVNFFQNLQDERTRLRHLLAVCPRIEV